MEGGIHNLCPAVTCLQNKTPTKSTESGLIPVSLCGHTVKASAILGMAYERFEDIQRKQWDF